MAGLPPCHRCGTGALAGGEPAFAARNHFFLPSRLRRASFIKLLGQPLRYAPSGSVLSWANRNQLGEGQSFVCPQLVDGVVAVGAIPIHGAQSSRQDHYAVRFTRIGGWDADPGMVRSAPRGCRRIDGDTMADAGAEHEEARRVAARATPAPRCILTFIAASGDNGQYLMCRLSPGSYCT